MALHAAGNTGELQARLQLSQPTQLVTPSNLDHVFERCQAHARAGLTMTTSAHLWAVGFDDMARAHQVRNEIANLGWGSGGIGKSSSPLRHRGSHTAF